MLKFDDRGLIPVIVQDVNSNEVVMLGYANKESGEVWFYSRSRQELWHKGATSGSILKVRGAILRDCDSDAILIRAEPAGPVCHTGNWSCFYQTLEATDIV
jgi:phosphoribosyl-AMP cyclohydrolase